MTEDELDILIKESVKQARIDVDIFAQMLQTPGWLRLQDIAKAQLTSRTEKVMTSTDQALSAQGTSCDFEKGVVQGIKLFMGLPEWATVAARETLNKHEVKKDESEETD